MSKLEVKVEETPFRASVLRETTKCKESVHVQEKIRKRPKTEVKICKLLFPRKSVYQKCKHVHDVIVERNMLTRTDQICTDLLAQPRTVNLKLLHGVLVKPDVFFFSVRRGKNSLLG